MSIHFLVWRALTENSPIGHRKFTTQAGGSPIILFIHCSDDRISRGESCDGAASGPSTSAPSSVVLTNSLSGRMMAFSGPRRGRGSGVLGRVRYKRLRGRTGFSDGQIGGLDTFLLTRQNRTARRAKSFESPPSDRAMRPPLFFRVKRPQFFGVLSHVCQDELALLPTTPGLIECIVHVRKQLTAFALLQSGQ
jgi:hypothetical protein